MNNNDEVLYRFALLWAWTVALFYMLRWLT